MDEGKAELLPVGVVQREEALALVLSEAVEAGRGLLGLRVRVMARGRAPARSGWAWIKASCARAGRRNGDHGA
jgi:hypothetical protein